MKLVLGMEVGLSPGDFVLDGDPAPSPKRGQSPQFSAHVYCGQTASWIKIPLGTEVGLSPDDIVLDGDPASPPQKGGWSPLPDFRPMSIVAKQLDGSKCHLAWIGGGPSSRPHCARWGPSCPQKKETPTVPNFWPMSIVVKGLDG